MGNQRIDERDLIALLVSHNKQGLELLYDNYSSAIYGLIYRIIQNEELAEELLVDVFGKTWNSTSQYEKGNLLSWMLKLARTLAIEKIRSKEFILSKSSDTLDVLVYIESHQFHLFNSELIGLREQVKKLEPGQKEIIDLSYFSGYTEAELAEKLNIPVSSVKTMAYSALMKLKQDFPFAVN